MQRFDSKIPTRLIRRISKLALISFLVLSACGLYPTTAPPATATVRPISTVTSTATYAVTNIYFVDGELGSDSNPGSRSKPWQTIQRAVEEAVPGDEIEVRGGEYAIPFGGWSFHNSGTPSSPITLSNYPGEQVVFTMNQVSDNNYAAFRCLRVSNKPPSWQTPDAQYIRILGSDVTPTTLSDGVASRKGIVIQGVQGEQSTGISIWGGCSHWEVAGVDFVETAGAIFTIKGDASPDGWYVHDNRVYNYYRESGMQFNGNNNTIIGNEIYKVSDELDTPYNCQMLNLLGHGNEVSGNKISRLGSTAWCIGILFEWDLSDQNTVEQNVIYDVPEGISFAGGDNNSILNNVIIAAAGTNGPGISITSYDNGHTGWPCNDVPITNPNDEDYPYLSNPHNCHSQDNRILGNTISGFPKAITMYPVVDTSNIIENNIVR